MFESADLTRVQLDVLKGVPRAYNSLLTQLSQAGLTETGGNDPASQFKLCSILSDYFDHYIVHG